MSIVREIISRLKARILRHRYPHVCKTAVLSKGVRVYNPLNLYMEENTNINPGAVILNSNANFILKKGSGAAHGLTVSTGNHMSIPGFLMKQVTQSVKEQYDTDHVYNGDVVVEEDVWIASNVTLLSSVHLGRGCEIGAGSVVRKSVPPYAIVIGNPAKVVGFRFTPEEVIEHEKALYSDEQRLSIDMLQKNYEKFFLSRINDIKQFTKL